MITWETAFSVIAPKLCDRCSLDPELVTNFQLNLLYEVVVVRIK